MTQRAQIGVSEARLTSEFGEKLARKYFGDDLIDGLPKFIRGKNPGKIKDHVVKWRKVVAGGWVRTPGGEGYVENRVGKLIEVELVYSPFRGEEKTIKGFYNNHPGREAYTA